MKIEKKLLIPHSSFFILHFSFFGRAPCGSGFRHGIHKATTEASAFVQAHQGGGFVADRECLYPSRIATRTCSGLWQQHRMSKYQILNTAISYFQL